MGCIVAKPTKINLSRLDTEEASERKCMEEEKKNKLLMTEEAAEQVNSRVHLVEEMAKESQGIDRSRISLGVDSKYPLESQPTPKSFSIKHSERILDQICSSNEFHSEREIERIPTPKSKEITENRMLIDCTRRSSDDKILANRRQLDLIQTSRDHDPSSTSETDRRRELEFPQIFHSNSKEMISFPLLDKPPSVESEKENDFDTYTLSPFNEHKRRYSRRLNTIRETRESISSIPFQQSGIQEDPDDKIVVDENYLMQNLRSKEPRKSRERLTSLVGNLAPLKMDTVLEENLPKPLSQSSHNFVVCDSLQSDWDALRDIGMRKLDLKQSSIEKITNLGFEKDSRSFFPSPEKSKLLLPEKDEVIVESNKVVLIRGPRNKKAQDLIYLCRQMEISENKLNPASRRNTILSNVQTKNNDSHSSSHNIFNPNHSESSNNLSMRSHNKTLLLDDNDTFLRNNLETSINLSVVSGMISPSPSKCRRSVKMAKRVPRGSVLTRKSCDVTALKDTPSINKSLSTIYINSRKGNVESQLNSSSVSYRRTMINDYIVLKKIGKGGWSDVLLAVDANTKKKYVAL